MHSLTMVLLADYVIDKDSVQRSDRVMVSANLLPDTLIFCENHYIEPT
jgi:hypothetical protein